MLLHEILPVLSEDAVVSGKADFLNIYKSTLGNVYISFLSRYLTFMGEEV